MLHLFYKKKVLDNTRRCVGQVALFRPNVLAPLDMSQHTDLPQKLEKALSHHPRFHGPPKLATPAPLPPPAGPVFLGAVAQ